MTITYITDGTPGAGFIGDSVKEASVGDVIFDIDLDIPNGYVFRDWTLNGVVLTTSQMISESLYTILTDEDITVVANFTERELPGEGTGGAYDGHLNYSSTPKTCDETENPTRREVPYVEEAFEDLSNEQGVKEDATHRYTDRNLYPGYENFEGLAFDVGGTIVAAKNEIRKNTELM